MLRILSDILDSVRQLRGRKRIAQQFAKQGFVEVDCPSVFQMLPLRYPEIVNDQNVAMFAKEDMQMLVVPTQFLPRTRLPHKGRTFVLLCTPLKEGELAEGVSAALRDPSEQYSIVDQLEMDSYPGLSPLPYATLFAKDDRSARAILQVVGLSKKQAGSIVLHAGRLLAQVSA